MAEGNGSNGQKSMAIVCWSSDLDRVWPVLILATTGAASGLNVNVFFTFWGLRVLQRNDKRITGGNWMQVGESVMDKGGTDHLKLGKMVDAGLPWLKRRGSERKLFWDIFIHTNKMRDA